MTCLYYNRSSDAVGIAAISHMEGRVFESRPLQKRLSQSRTTLEMYHD